MQLCVNRKHISPRRQTMEKAVQNQWPHFPSEAIQSGLLFSLFTFCHYSSSILLPVPLILAVADFSIIAIDVPIVPVAQRKPAREKEGRRRSSHFSIFCQFTPIHILSHLVPCYFNYNFFSERFAHIVMIAFGDLDVRDLSVLNANCLSIKNVTN